MKKLFCLFITLALVSSYVFAEENVIELGDSNIKMEPVDSTFLEQVNSEINLDSLIAAPPCERIPGSDRMTCIASKVTQGTSLPVPKADILDLCGDKDGCKIRMGLHNFDATGQTASREALFFYNPENFAWRSSASGDPTGRDYDGTNSEIFSAWSCKFTDGEYENYVDMKDSKSGFGLVLWKEFTGDCWMTIID